MEFVDPFAPADSKTDEKESDTSVSQETSNEGKIVTTYKLSGDYSAPWIVTYTGNAEEARALANSPDFKRHMAETFQIWRWLRETCEESGLGKPPPSAGPTGRPAADKPLPPGIPLIECDHGLRVYASKGNWAALFCAADVDTPKHEKCEPFWKQKDGSFAPNSK